MPMGGTVIIAGGHEDPVTRPAAGVLAPAATGLSSMPVMPTIAGPALHLEPRRSGEGPVSIIVSTGDQQVVVLRNGVEIGRAHAVVRSRPPSRRS